MNSFWHLLILHGPKFAIFAIAIGGRLWRWQAQRAAKNRPKMPPQSAPSAPPIGAPSSQQAFKTAPLKNAPSINAPSKTATRPLKNQSSGKNDGSPWSSNDPFNS